MKRATGAAAGSNVKVSMKVATGATSVECKGKHEEGYWGDVVSNVKVSMKGAIGETTGSNVKVSVQHFDCETSTLYALNCVFRNDIYCNIIYSSCYKQA